MIAKALTSAFLLVSPVFFPFDGVSGLTFAPLVSDKPCQHQGNSLIMRHNLKQLTGTRRTSYSTCYLSTKVDDIPPDGKDKAFGRVDPFAQGYENMKQLDMDVIINTAVIVGLSVAVLSKLATIDVGMMRGWTAAEMAVRIPVDNFHSYSSILDKAPVYTKAVTSATVYTIGDFISQRTEGKEIGDLDRGRMIRSLLAGLIGHGPLSHVWYNWSEGIFNDVFHWTQWWSFVPKIGIDQLLWGPFWNNSYIVLLGLMKLEKPEVIWDDIKRTTIPLVVSGLKLWPLAHCVTYGLMPVQYRLVWVDLVEIIWVTILSSQAAGGTTESGNEAESKA